MLTPHHAVLPARARLLTNSPPGAAKSLTRGGGGIGSQAASKYEEAASKGKRAAKRGLRAVGSGGPKLSDSISGPSSKSLRGGNKLLNKPLVRHAPAAGCCCWHACVLDCACCRARACCCLTRAWRCHPRPPLRMLQVRDSLGRLRPDQANETGSAGRV